MARKRHSLAATYDVFAIRDDYDDLSDFNTEQMDSQYDCVGRLLKPGEEANIIATMTAVRVG
uniref:Uncharacterized protein n=1 Tax=Strigamia maritima TaxID=126957 RepID=T1ING7_STRMM